MSDFLNVDSNPALNPLDGAQPMPQPPSPEDVHKQLLDLLQQIIGLMQASPSQHSGSADGSQGCCDASSGQTGRGGGNDSLRTAALNVVQQVLTLVHQVMSGAQSDSLVQTYPGRQETFGTTM